jgi:hypothetical protein
MIRPDKRKVRRVILIGLTLYLLFFSGFAVFHSYANDELFDTHGCQIGEWVLHGQAAFFGIDSVSAVVLMLDQVSPIQEITEAKPHLFAASLRAPPNTLL